MAFLVVCVLAMYSALVIHKMIMSCHLLLQKMAPSPIMNTNLVVDLLSSRSPAQLASQYPTKSWGGNPPKRNLNCKMPCKYQKMCLTAILCFEKVLPSLAKACPIIAHQDEIININNNEKFDIFNLCNI